MPLPRLFALHAIGLTTQKLKTSHAFHSPLMDAMLADFARVARQIAYAPPRLDIVSNLTGEFISDEIASPEYWCRHVRQPVKFMTGMRHSGSETTTPLSRLVLSQHWLAWGLVVCRRIRASGFPA